MDTSLTSNDIPQTSTMQGVDSGALVKVAHLVKRANLNNSPGNWSIKMDEEDPDGLRIVATSYVDGTRFVGTHEEFNAMIRGE